MEFINHQADYPVPIYPSEETNQPDQNSNVVGTGRFYECMFCKRGFTNAQALGGHMNIHRKDRVKSSKSTNSSTKYDLECNYGSARIYQPVFSSYLQHYLVTHDAQVHYQTYFPPLTNNLTQASYEQNSFEQNQHGISSPCREDMGMGLSLQFGSHYYEDMDQSKKVGFYEDGLDLELRLGHEP